MEDDEYYITLALLHGCMFHKHTEYHWYVSKSNDVHPVEQVHVNETGGYAWKNRKELAKDYCKFYKLGTHGGNDERSNQPTCSTD